MSWPATPRLFRHTGAAGEQRFPLGRAAGLGTALLWAISPIMWGLAGRRVTALSVAAVRILLSAIILTGVHWVVFGGPWPTGLDWEPVLFLAASGILGMGLGDICYFHNLVRIGPRLATLISSAYPIATTLIAWTTMHETLSAQAVCGIALNVAGVAWVVSERTDHKTWPREPGHLKQGVFLLLM